MNVDGPFKPIPQKDALGCEPDHVISEFGQMALSIIRDGEMGINDVAPDKPVLIQRDLYFLRHNYVSLHAPRHKSAAVDFGGVGDSGQASCTITLSAASQDAGPEGDLVPVRVTEQIIIGKEMMITLLSSVKPGEVARVEGTGEYIEQSETFTPDEQITAEASLNYDNRFPVDVVLELELAKNCKAVMFRFRAEGEDGDVDISEELMFEKKGFMARVHTLFSSRKK